MKSLHQWLIGSNSYLCHVCLHLSPGLFIFQDFDICNIYYQQCRRVSQELNVAGFDFLTMPNHVHLNLESEDPTLYPKFLQRVNTGFGKIVRNLKKRNGEPLITNGIVFHGSPFYCFQHSYERAFGLFRYFYNNPIQWKKKYGKTLPLNSDGEYYPSGVARFLKNDAEFIDTDRIQRRLSISFDEIIEVRKMPQEEYLKFLADFKIKHPIEEERKAFLINPKKKACYPSLSTLEIEKKTFNC